MTVLDHITRNQPEDGNFELLGIRLVELNALCNPLLYIVLRKENLQKILTLIRRIKYKIKGGDNESQPIIEMP